MIEKREIKEISVKQVIIFTVLISILTLSVYFIGKLSSNPRALYGSLAAVFIPPMGKESIIPILLVSGIIPLTIFVSILLLDLIACFIVLTCFEMVEYLLYSFPVLKRGMSRVEKKVNRLERYELVSIGLIGFMFVPFQGTGAITTSILAQILRVKDWKTVLIVFIGSVTSTVFFLTLSMGIIQLF